MNDPITVEVQIHAPIESVWNDFTDPKAIQVWNSASPDWHTPRAENDLRIGGTFAFRMEARDGSAGFDLTGTYTNVDLHEHIAYMMEDGRNVSVIFIEEKDAVRIVETFDPESENPIEMQRSGWQAILDNFKKYAEAH